MLRSDRSANDAIAVKDLLDTIANLQAKVHGLEHSLKVTEDLLDSANNSKSILMKKLRAVQEAVGSGLDEAADKTMKQLLEEHLDTLK